MYICTLFIARRAMHACVIPENYPLIVMTSMISRNKILKTVLILLFLAFTVNLVKAKEYTISMTTGWVKNSNGSTSGQAYYQWWYSNDTNPLVTITSGAGNAIAVSGDYLSIYPGGSGNSVNISVSDGYLITGVSFDYQSNGSTMSYNSQTIVAANASGSWSKQDFDTNQVTFRFGGANVGTVLSNFIVSVKSLEDGFDMVYKGTLASGYKSRIINTIFLNGQSVAVGEDYSYFDKTSQEFIVNEGETLAAGFTWGGSWMHGYIYIDLNKNGSFKPYGIKADGTPADGSDLVAYSAYSPTGNNADYKNSAGTATNNNPGINPPSFTAPSYGIYRMRYKTDWNSLLPCGGSSFATSGGVAIDVTLKVRKRYSLVIVNPRDNMSITIDGSERAAYNAEGDVFSTNYALIPSDINATDATSITVEGSTITVTYKELRWETITSLDQITDPDGLYVADDDIEYIDGSNQIAEFRGVFDGNFKKIRNTSRALFGTLNNGTVKNLILQDVSISGTTVGAIANVATGNSRVYNCGVISGTVNGSTEAGSIVGRIEGNARVVNCYSYADVSGGTVAGIVGNNNGTSAAKETVFNGTGTLVMNCAHFGTLSGTSVYPVFGGNDINNVSGVNTYNYYLYDAAVTYVSPNSAQGTEETSFFNRFDFYRSILNSHKELAAMYIYGTQNITDAQRDDIAHWTYDSSVAQYLSQEPWQKNTRSTLDRSIPTTGEAYKGKQVGSVSATFIINGHNENVTLPITDMDTERWDYTYGKVVLPFANEFTGWSLPASGSTAYDNIITGWEVTSITGGTAGTYANYNLCDPDCTNKDLYANNNYVWAQGGNFVVPKGVTGITFTAHIGRAVYLRDTHPDIAYSANYGTRTNLGSAITGTYNGKTVYNSMETAFAQLEARSNPADQAIVLVGNYHFNKEGVFPNAYGGTSPVAGKAVTIMSIDADNNQEPDYCFYQYNTSTSGRVVTPPLRFDFITSPDFAMASYTKGGLLAGIGIIHAGGWFETTETATLKMTEFEMRPQNYTQASPVILNGGVFTRIAMTSTNEYGASTDNLLYTKIGGKVHVTSLNLGRTTSLITAPLSLHPLNVSGGEIINCHLTGAILNGATSGDAYFYCNGGYIHEFNGAYQEKLNGNMTAMMDHALIDEFYGGGSVETNNQITGDINITCNNSYIKFFCGGPKFGNMASGKTVTVNANGSAFDEYYGASYGGTALTIKKDGTGSGSTFTSDDNSFNLAWSTYTSRRLIKASDGIAVDFDLDFFQYAGGGQNKGNQEFSVKYASLSLAQTGSVTSTMTNCTFNSHFFGGGCRGKVAGNVTSVLTDCIVKGNAYGGGYTPTATECMVYPASPQPTYPVYKGLYGLFTKYVRTADSEPYHWAQADGSHAAGSVDTENKLLYTDINMSQMGEVTGNTSLTIKGSASVVTGDVFGGGAESKVLGNTNVIIGNQP